MSRGPRASDLPQDWGEDDTGASVLHVDMDAFFASVEIALRPALRGKTVIVGRHDRGVVVAASYEARKFGVRSAMPMSRALRLCPGAIVIPPTHQRYHDVSADVMDLMRDITPVVEVVSIDEAYLDISGVRRRWGSAVAIAQHIRAEVEKRHGVTASVGIGTSPVVAKLASTHAKPDGLLLIPAARTIEFLHRLPVGAIPGVGPATQDVLHKWGIYQVADLAHTQLSVLRRIIGQAHAVRLHEIAWNRHAWRIEPERVEKSIGTETTFAADLRGAPAAERAIFHLADRTASRARRAQMLGRVVVLKVRTDDFHTFSRSRTLTDATDDARVINRIAQELFRAHDPGRGIRLLGVRLEGLSPTETTARQLSFDELLQSDGGGGREVIELVDQVRERFGVDALKPGTLIERTGRDAQDD